MSEMFVDQIRCEKRDVAEESEIGGAEQGLYVRAEECLMHEFYPIL